MLIELKRDRTPRDVVSQALDYASWVEELTAEDISRIYVDFSEGDSLNKAFEKKFGTALEEDTLNQAHQAVIVAAELDDSTERIINYLSKGNIPINVLFFKVFEHDQTKLLSRAWLIEPTEAPVEAPSSEREPWNGEFYVNYDRDWGDALRYGLISAGGGSFYSRTLGNLSPGDRIWVKIPGKGFVGVGRVTSSRRPIKDLKVQTSDGPMPALEVLRNKEDFRTRAADPERADYFVGVEWIDTVSETSEAFHEAGLFGNQNTVVRPRTPKWGHTIDRLKTRFPNWNG